MKPCFEWDQAAIARLREKWLAGDSVVQIGIAMGLTKNAVVGKAHRLRLPGRPSPIRPPDGRPAKAGPAGPVTLPALRLPAALPNGAHPAQKGDHRPLAARPRHTLMPAPGAAEPFALAEASPAAPPPPRLAGKRRCCWPMWGMHERPTHRYCDAPRDDGGMPYCAQHRAEATARPRSAAEIEADHLRGPRPGVLLAGQAPA